MPQSTHDRAAELHNLAAHAHAAAATAHGKGDHLTALSKQAHEHSMNAHKLAEELGTKAASSSKAKGGVPELRADLNPPHK
jgi:MOSC domain-containing protein YiiM